MLFASRQWGVATGINVETHTSARFDVTLPINYQKQIAQALVTIADGGTSESWESTTVWVKGGTVKSFVAGMAAGHAFTIPPKIRWATLGE